MEKLRNEECLLEQREFPHESEICDSGRCVKCNDGMWEDIDDWACCIL